MHGNGGKLGEHVKKRTIPITLAPMLLKLKAEENIGSELPFVWTPTSSENFFLPALMFYQAFKWPFLGLMAFYGPGLIAMLASP